MIDRRALLIVGGLGLLALTRPDARAAVASAADAVASLGTGRLSLARVKALAEEIGPPVGADPLVVRAVVEIESARYPDAFRDEPHIGDASVGLMQTLLGTAKEVWDVQPRVRPYVPRRPEAYDDLTDPAASIALGSGYLYRVQYWGGRSHPLEWYVRAYNGGPGGATASYTRDYWEKFRAAFIRLGGSDPGPATY